MKQLFDISGCETVTHFALGIKTYTNFCYFLLPLPCDEECNFKFRYRTKLNISQSTLDEFLFSRKDWVQLSLLLLYKKSHVWWSTSGAWSLIYIQLVPCMKDVSVYKKKKYCTIPLFENSWMSSELKMFYTGINYVLDYCSALLQLYEWSFVMLFEMTVPCFLRMYEWILFIIQLKHWIFFFLKKD